MDSELDPEIFCQGYLDKHHHDESEEKMAFGFLLLLLVAFLTTFLLYVYHKVPALHILPEAVTGIIVGILIGIGFKIIYRN